MDPTDSGFDYDNYGRGKCISVSDLYEAVTARPTIFFPNYASGEETGARRGCVVLAQGEVAGLISRDVSMLTEFIWTDALILDGIAELRTGAIGTKSLEFRLIDVQSHSAHLELRVHELSDALARAELARRQEELKAENASRDAAAAREATAKLQDVQSHSARLELRVHEMSGALVRAEFAHRQEELKAENAGRDAAAAREATVKLQALMLRLHEELHSARQTSALDTQRAIALSESEAGLQQKLRTAEARAAEQLQLAEARVEQELAHAERAAQQVTELQRSRWRRIGLRLGLARKATFEI